MCNSSRSNLLPDRVLDLGTSSDPNDQSPISLYETFDVKLNVAKYVCLSHCWGRTHHITTTSSTIQDRKAGVKWNELPKTFQDAITFTRRLGIRYLWIDSLCIVQDDLNDWSVQSSKMPSIYENAYVTLAATFSPSSAGGCFSQAGSEFRARNFTVQDRSGKPQKIFVRRHLPHWLMADPRRLQELDQDFPLLQRAWVLQERLLSPRVLHFGRHELMWECMEATACECSFLDHVEPENINKIMHHRSFVPGNQSHAALGEKWHAIVSSYSWLAMTYGKDKLQAISGMARQMNRALNDTYIAGLWKSSLITDMLWETYDPQARPSPWRSPTWSWASVTTPVIYRWKSLNEGQEVTSHVEILQTKAVPADKDDMGQLKYADMKIKAEFCVSSIIVYTKDPAKPRAAEPQLVVNKQIFNNDMKEGTGLVFIPRKVELDVSVPPTTPSTEFAGYDVGETGRGVLCMRLATVGSYEYTLLLFCVDHPLGIYERIGIASEDRLGEQSGMLPWGDPEKCFQSIITLV